MNSDTHNEMNELPVPEDEKERIVSALVKMMEMGMGAVYGDEDDDVPDAEVCCNDLIDTCKAKCCMFTFALTKDEVEAGKIDHNRKKPFFIARDDDGYCPHLERDSMKCSVWDDRPLRCRRYDCTNDPHVWGDSE